MKFKHLGLALMVLPLAIALGALLLIDETTWSRWLPAIEPHLPRLLRGEDAGPSSLATGGALLLAVVALIGSVAPAIGASRIDPVRALSSD